MRSFYNHTAGMACCHKFQKFLRHKLIHPRRTTPQMIVVDVSDPKVIIAPNQLSI